MTKKELLENEVFKALPDDAKIVMCVNKNTDMVAPLEFKDITAVHNPQGTYLVIDGLTFEMFEQFYHINFDFSNE